MADTLADRIMATADNYASERWAVGTGVTMADDRAEAHRATLAALVAEACAPVFSGALENTVCRWEYQGERDDWYRQACTGDGYGYIPGVFCPECGGRIELADGRGRE